MGGLENFGGGGGEKGEIFVAIMSGFEARYLEELAWEWSQQLSLLLRECGGAGMPVEMVVDRWTGRRVFRLRVGGAERRVDLDALLTRESFLSALDGLVEWAVWLVGPRGDAELEAMRDGLMAEEEWAA